MAYDKVVDSTALDASLTAIADAIREKAGTSDAMTLDGMAEAIAAISAGGGGAEIAFGSFTIGSYPGSLAYEFEHGLPQRPIMFAIVTIDAIARMSTYTTLTAVVQKYNTNSSIAGQGNIYTTTKTTVDAACDRVSVRNSNMSDTYGIRADNLRISIDMTGTKTYLVNAVPYYWFAVGEIK